MCDRIIEAVATLIPKAYRIGHRYQRLPGHICLGFAGQEGEAIKLLLALDEAGIAVSSGSACNTHHAGEPSSVLLAMGFDPIRARGSLRITLGRFNTKAEEDQLPVKPRAMVSDQTIPLACGACAGSRPVTGTPESAWRDSLGREFDFYLEHFPEEPGPREIILPHNPLLTREMDIQPGEVLIGRPLETSCGRPITHCGVTMQVDQRTGVIA